MKNALVSPGRRVSSARWVLIAFILGSASTPAVAARSWAAIQNECALAVLEGKCRRLCIERMLRLVDQEPRAAKARRERSTFWRPYVPYAVLAGLYANCGNFEAAREMLEASEREGVAATVKGVEFDPQAVLARARRLLSEEEDRPKKPAGAAIRERDNGPAGGGLREAPETKKAIRLVLGRTLRVELSAGEQACDAEATKIGLLERTQRECPPLPCASVACEGHLGAGANGQGECEFATVELFRSVREFLVCADAIVVEDVPFGYQSLESDVALLVTAVQVELEPALRDRIQGDLDEVVRARADSLATIKVPAEFRTVVNHVLERAWGRHKGSRDAQ